MNSMKRLYLSGLLVCSALMASPVQAAVSLVGSGKAAKADAGTMTVTAHSSTTAGDVMILFLGTSDTTPLTALSGWTQIMTKGPDDIALTTLYRVYKSGDSKTINIAVKHCSFATVVSLRGVDQSNPIADKKAYKDWGTTSQTENGTGTPKGTSFAPSVNGINGGALVCGFMWDDPYHDCSVSGMSVLHSYANADDGLTVAYQNLSAGGSTGMRKAVAPNQESGGGNEIGMSVSVRPSTTATPTLPSVGSIITMKAVNGKYVTANYGSNNTLIANKTTVSNYERFKVVSASGGVALQCMGNSKYVSIDKTDGSIPMVADRTSVGTFEVFKLILADGEMAIQSVLNDQYVSAMSGGDAPLQAIQTRIGSYEKFTWKVE